MHIVLDDEDEELQCIIMCHHVAERISLQALSSVSSHSEDSPRLAGLVPEEPKALAPPAEAPARSESRRGTNRSGQRRAETSLSMEMNGGFMGRLSGLQDSYVERADNRCAKLVTHPHFERLMWPSEAESVCGSSGCLW